jgi:hypothetical protein
MVAHRRIRLFRRAPHLGERNEPRVRAQDVVDRRADHLERPVELQQQRIEQHDVADAEFAAAIARQQHREGHADLHRQHQPEDQRIADPAGGELRPVVAHVARLLGEAARDPLVAAEIAQRLHGIDGIADELRVRLIRLVWRHRDAAASSGWRRR